MTNTDQSSRNSLDATVLSIPSRIIGHAEMFDNQSFHVIKESMDRTRLLRMFVSISSVFFDYVSYDETFFRKV